MCLQDSSSSSAGITARCGLWLVEQYLSIFLYLTPTLSIFSLPALEDLFLLFLSILSWVFLFVSSLPFLEWRSFWASYPPPYSPSDPANLSFAPLLFAGLAYEIQRLKPPKQITQTELLHISPEWLLHFPLPIQFPTFTYSQPASLFITMFWMITTWSHSLVTNKRGWLIQNLGRQRGI